MNVQRESGGRNFAPPGHDVSRSTILFDRENGFDKAVLHITVLGKGGGSTSEEQHDLSDQVFYVISGQVEVYSEGKHFTTLKEGDALHVKAGDWHAFKNEQEETCRLYVLTVPPL